MLIAGAVYFSQWDVDAKKNSEVMKACITALSKQADFLFLYGNKLVDSDMIAFCRSLPNLAKLTIDDTDFREGWVFKGMKSLAHAVNQIDRPCDWVLFPDSDDTLPGCVRAAVEEADKAGCTCVEFPRVDVRWGDRILDTRDYPGGPHVLAAKMNPKPTWDACPGFNIPDNTSPRMIYHCRYPSRHYRYATPALIKARKEAAYAEPYADKDSKTTEFRPDWTWDDYERHFTHG